MPRPKAHTTVQARIVGALAMRPMRHKWASSSTSGNRNFNGGLLDLECEIGDYVIVHELLHFFAPNHGKLWKSLMRAHLGDYARLEHALQEAATSPAGHSHKRPVAKMKFSTWQNHLAPRCAAALSSQYRRRECAR